MGFSYAKTLLKDPHILNSVAFNPIPKVMGKISSNPTAQAAVDNTVGQVAKYSEELAKKVSSTSYYQKAAAAMEEGTEALKKARNRLEPRIGASLETMESRARIAHTLSASHPGLASEHIAAGINAAVASGEKSMALPLSDYARYRYTNYDGSTNLGRMGKDAGIAAGAAVGLGAAGYGAAHFFGDD